MKIAALSILSVWLLSSCGEDSNFNQFFSSKEQDETLDVLVYKAEKLYNEGEYAAALEAIQKAEEQSTTNEDVAVLKSYIYLSLANVDVFQVSANMIKLQTGQGCGSSTTTSTSDSSSGSSDAAGALSQLTCLIGMSTTDISTNLALENNQSGEILGVPTKEELAKFAAIPLYLPKTAADARASGSAVLSNINNVISTACPYVNDGAKVISTDATDSRHQCTAYAGARYQTGKSHLVWALAHLIEALAFHSVVLYTDPNQTDPSLVARSTVLSTFETTTSNLAEFVALAEDLSAVIDIILPVDETAAANSMLTGMFNDLDAVSKGFAQFGDSAASITGSISTAIKGLNEKRDQIKASQSSTDTKDASSVALKGQLTAAVSTKLKSKIETDVNDGTLSGQEKTDACAAYASIADDTLSVCQ